ncbi:hypothetical protein PLICRDRAFT_170264 [Plicaturopsis crispa FD-325 SS-3]|nr:hypothetical protein PLICRDRAFT_170264 [Plicaturopsis crispa FD-325 SS-3]
MAYETTGNYPRANSAPNGARVLFNAIPDEDRIHEMQVQNTAPTRKRTQKDQDDADESARKKAMKDLVQSWMDRLQLISVITTFFASTEAGLLQVTTPDDGDQDSMSGVAKAANASLVGALIMHTFAGESVVSFLASFYLIRYKLHVAKKEEIKAENPDKIVSPMTNSPQDIEKEGEQKQAGWMSSTSKNERPYSPASEPPIWSSNPHLVQVGPFQRDPPTDLLSRCHSLCVFVSAIGFVLMMTAILTFAWARLPSEVSGFASASLGLCLVAGVLIIFV